MKKVLIIVLLSLSMSMFAFKPMYSKWTATVEAGVNRFDGDINQALVNTFPTSNWNPTIGGNIEYKLTPVYGLSLNGYYVPINANTQYYIIPLAQSSLINVTTKISTIAINGTVDFTHLMFPYTKTKWTVNGSIGIGYAYYKYGFHSLPDSYGNAVTMPTSISLKYNASDRIDVGAKVSYICFNKDNLEGLHGWKGVTNDRVGLGTIFISYKFNPKRYPVKDNTLQLELSKVSARVYDLNKKVKKQSDKLDTLTSYVLNRTENTCIKDTNILVEDIPAVYFDFDKADLDDWALITISKFAEILQDNPKFKVDILGYCDYIGNEPYNFKLSDKRVARVKKELVEIWRIDPKRICTDGRGKLNDPKMKYRPNRRCDLFIIK